MSNLSDNELDKLSREAAEKFEPADDAQSWNRLEQLLDKNLGKPSPVPKLTKPGIPLIYSGAILLVIGISYYLIKTKKDNQNSTPKNFTLSNQQSAENKILRNDSATVLLNEKKDQQKNADNKTDNANDVSATTANNSETAINKDDKKDKADNAKSIVAGKLNANRKNDNNAEKANDVQRSSTDNAIQKSSALIKPATGKLQREKNTDEKSFTVNNKDRNSAKNKNGNDKTIGKQSSGENDETENSLSSSNSAHQLHSLVNDKKHQQTNKKQNNKDGDAATNTITADKNNASVQYKKDEDLKFAEIPTIIFLNNGITQINDSGLRSFNNKTQISNVIKPAKSNYHAAFVNRSLQIGILFAPEFSKVKYIYDNNRLGNSFGITLSYQLLSKLSVNTGVIISKKYYQANEKQFHGPQNAAGTNNDIEFVNASANVIDIPLNIRYNYFADGNSTFFVNAGLSSYIMKKEDFDYYCHYYNNNGGFQVLATRWVPQPQAPPSKNNLFSIINLSTGFETAINNSFSFQFEPYMKLPLKGVGFGKVDLSSYGIIFSIKYSPILNRGRH